jgi:hypothetical protein
MADSKRDEGGGTDGRMEQAKDAALGRHDSNPGVADHVGEAAGGISGVLVGAGIGSAGGPIGTIIGGIAGAMGGWWTGRAVSEAATTLTRDDEDYYRKHYEASPDRPADRGYEQVRGAYYLGHLASHNPNFTNRQFDEVEPELERGWKSAPESYGNWMAVRNYAREGWTRGTTRRDTPGAVREQAPGERPGDARR